MKKVSRMIASIMLAIAIGFILYVLNHPEGSWPWSNTVTYVLYGVYAIIMFVLFIAPFQKSKPTDMAS